MFDRLFIYKVKNLRDKSQMVLKKEKVAQLTSRATFSFIGVVVFVILLYLEDIRSRADLYSGVAIRVACNLDVGARLYSLSVQQHLIL